MLANVGELAGVEGPLEELEEEDGRLVDEEIELNEEVREFDGVGDPTDVAGLPARCAKLPFLGVRLGSRATLRRGGVLH